MLKPCLVALQALQTSGGRAWCCGVAALLPDPGLRSADFYSGCAESVLGSAASTAHERRQSWVCCWVPAQSFFCCHVEDVDLCSINYLHFGAPKVRPALRACVSVTLCWRHTTIVCYMACTCTSVSCQVYPKF